MFNKNIRIGCVTIMLNILLLVILYATLAEAANPVELFLIERDSASYNTPENAYVSLLSSMYYNDIEWYYDSSTKESAEKERLRYEESNFNIQQIFDTVKDIQQIFLLDKVEHHDGVALIVEIQKTNGSIYQGPSIFIKEEGLWKSKPDISADDPILNHLYYVPPLFYGKGQKPNDVNSFLGYLQPTQAQTEMQPDTTHYTIHLYYGRTINPETFKAELNKQDITQQFSPTPLTDQEVEISLQKGRNVLILSTEGVRKDGKKANDKDRLVFIVP